MQFKKACGKIFGVSFTAQEKKAMEKEINRQIAEGEIRHAKDIDAMVLWVLHERFGFGIKRLREFWEEFERMHKELHDYYELDMDKNSWICDKKLKEDGIDISSWYEEIEN